MKGGGKWGLGTPLSTPSTIDTGISITSDACFKPIFKANIAIKYILYGLNA